MLLLSIFFTGCTTFAENEWEKDTSKILIPVNVGLAYFGSVGLHESGHTLTAYGIGATEVDVDMFPMRDEDGRRHFASTHAEFKEKPSDLELSLFNIMGPMATFAGHVGTRELLKSGTIPKILQPTLAWFGLFNRISYYTHVVTGLSRMEGQDLSNEKAWVAGVMLAGGLAYDLYDFLSDGKPEYQYLLLFGEHFYKPKRKRREVSLRLISQPRRGGGFFGFVFNW